MGALVQGYFTSNLPFSAMTNSLPMTFFDPETAMHAAIALEETNQSQIDEFKKNNIKPLVYRYLPNYKLICTKPVRTMADLKKLKVRTFGNYMPKMFAAIDVTPVNVLANGKLRSAEARHDGLFLSDQRQLPGLQAA